MQVMKRDGSVVEFDRHKIELAIEKANAEMKHKYMMANEILINSIIDYIEAAMEGNEIPSVEDIQDCVENGLMEAGKHELARAYITYRYRRALARKANTTDESILSLLRGQNKELEEENSNKNTFVASTQRDYIAGEVSRDLTRRILLPEEVSKAHDEGVLHFHDADYFVQPIFNCFSGDTKFITDKGVVAFKDYKDGEKVMVLNKDGLWKSATVRNYGKQVMYDIRLRAGRTEKIVTATKDHRWILKDGNVTTDLKVGDTLWGLISTEGKTKPETKRECEMWCFGFVLGDGSDCKKGVAVRLCGNKTDHYDTFKAAGYACTHNIASGDSWMYKSENISKQQFLSSSGWRYLSREDKRMLFLGYYAADGCKDRRMIHTADPRLADMIREISALAGYHICAEKLLVRDTNFKDNAELYQFSFMEYQGDNRRWKVIHMEPHDDRQRPMDAWCVEEPETHSFTLEGGVVTGNCCLINIGDMLDNGTVVNGKMIESPKSFRVACTIMTQIIACVASNQYGGQSVDLCHLGKYLRRSADRIWEKLQNRGLSGVECRALAHELLQEELRAGVQTIQYQINTLMTTNGQSPFVTLFLNIPEGHEYENEIAMIVEEVLTQRLQGIKNEKGVYVTPAFPKLVYVLDEHNCLKGGKYDYITELAVKCSAKRMYPDYISAKKMKENYEGNVFSPMGCRSFLSPWKDAEGNYQFEGRFNQGVVSINLPQVALASGGDMGKFWELLEERLELCFKAIMCRHEALRKVKSDSSPIHWQNGAIARLPKGASIEPLLYGGYSSISLGYIGVYEMTKYMLGVSHTDPVGEQFALKVMNRLKEKVMEWREKTNIGFALYGTPAESLCYRFARIDKEKYGDIPDITDKGYYTNSYHVDVRENIDAFSKFTFESQFQKISTGGCISYVEIPNMRHNLEALKDVVRYIYDNIQYAEFNTKSDYCQCCGFDGEIEINDDNQWECPACHNKDKTRMNVTRRTCGYLGENYWNEGKTKEIKSRVLHL